MHQIILILKFILFLFNLYSITINLFIPFYYTGIKKYKIHTLKNKNIPANINQRKQTSYIHPMLTLNSVVILIILIYDFFN